MGKATKTVYSRNANLWGFEGYYMCVLEAMAQGETPHLDAILEYLCISAVRQNYMATKHSTMINQFILALHNCRSSCGANPLTTEDKSIHHHNFRTTEKPDHSPFHANVAYIAFRIEAVCNVIKKVLNLNFKPEEVRRAIDESDFGFFGRAYFYNVAELGFPISKTHFDETTNACMTVPLREDELQIGHLKEFRCAFLRTRKFDEIVAEVDNVMRDVVDYKTIMIKSAEPGIGMYNFYEAITLRAEEPWYGYRVLGSTNFGKYCGVQNEVCNMRYPEKVELLEGLDLMCYTPTTLLSFYRYDGFVDPNALPDSIRINPFIFRNGETDHPMPNDDLSKRYHNGAPFDNDESDLKRGRDDELRSGGTFDPQHEAPGSIPRGGGVTKTPRVEDDKDLGEDLMDDDEEEVRYTPHPAP